MSSSNPLRTFIKKLEDIIFYHLIDGYKLPVSCPKTMGISELLGYKIKYTLANYGFILTENEKKLSLYRNKHKGERCFIIGNGPSLNKGDLRRLKNEYTFGVNSIFLNYEKMGFYPTYYVVEDILVAEDRSEQINCFENSVKFMGNHLNYCIKDTENTIWINVIMRYSDYADFPNFSVNALRRIWAGGTVSYLCMQLAYYMGFSEVYLVGFDHSYDIPKDAVVDGNVILSMSDDPNHFDGNYFGKGYRWHDPRVDRMELSYRKARYFFERDGRKIFNATIGGKLEVFERVNYEDLFVRGEIE